MRRIVGAWLVFCIVALPNAGKMTTRLVSKRFTDAPADPPPVTGNQSPARSGGQRGGKFIPHVHVLPSEKTAPVSQQLPSDFLSDPLLFFSNAPAESLVQIPGIGPVLAARICDARSGKRFFKNWDELQQIKGIGKKTILSFKKLVAPDRPAGDGRADQP